MALEKVRMRRVIATEFVTLDGQIVGPEDSDQVLPCCRAEDVANDIVEQLRLVDAILLGRLTYQMMARHPPMASSDEALALWHRIRA
jgi:hypothetical protein